MGFRTVSEAREQAGKSSTWGRGERESSRRSRQQFTAQDCEQRFGMDMYKDGLEVVLQRLVQHHGADQIQQWADEGMTVETIGKPHDMEAFRERQQERPPEVPKDIERRNAKSVQRSRDAHLAPSKAGEGQVPDSVRDVISSLGQPLDADIQKAMEDRMGDSLGDVRIHTGAQAAKACDDIKARAFTVGNHIAFNGGEFDPESAEGQHVLAHELAHVRQQTGGAVSMLPQEGELAIDPDERLERQAEETAERVMRGGTIGVHRMRRADVHVQRLNSQHVSQDSMKGWADSFDIRNYTDENKEIIKDGSISPDVGEAVTRNIRKQTDVLQERGDVDDPKNLHQNIAFAKIEIGDSSFWVAAASGKRASNETNEDNPLIPGPFSDERVFDHRTDDDLEAYSMWDSEAKIIEHLAHEFDLENTKGEIKLYTERPPCDSCSVLLEKFGWDNDDRDEIFKDIEMDVSYDEALEEEGK